MDIIGRIISLQDFMRAFLTKRCHAVVPMINKNKDNRTDEIHESEHEIKWYNIWLQNKVAFKVG